MYKCMSSTGWIMYMSHDYVYDIRECAKMRCMGEISLSLRYKSKDHACQL